MNQNRLIITIFSFLLSLGLGFWLGKGIVSIDSIPKTQTKNPTDAPQTTIDLPKSFSFLWIGIDNFGSSTPSLQTMWWIQVAEFSPVKMIPLYPNPQLTRTQDQELRESFVVNQQSGNFLIAQDFFSKLKETPEWDAYLVFDENALENLIDLLGGVNLGKGVLNGRQAVSQLNSISQPVNYLNLQTILWGEICWNTTSTKPDTVQLSKAYNRHSFSQPGSLLKPSDWPGLLNQTDIPACSFPLAASLTQPAQ
jgi:hypothetical protein